MTDTHVVTVRDYDVTFRQSFPMETDADIMGLFGDLNLRDLNTAIPLLARVIESWDRDGDPSDEATYRAMDAPEVYTLARAADAYMTELLFGEPKNGESVST